MLRGRKQILVVDDEPNLRRVLGAQLMRDGYDVHTAADGEEALGILQENHIDLVITDLKMPRLDGMALLRRSQALDAELPVIMITAHATVDNAVEALKTGAFDYVTKPFDQAEVRAVVRKALRTRDLSATEATRPEEGSAPDRGYGIIGESPAIRELCSVLDRASDTPATVLVTGESGTGKELVARALHESSSRAARPFIKINCAAIPRELMEAEFFGYERGAFTGAVASKPGRFELAHGGTLFLDEIGAVPADIQVKLLRALQEGEFERVGGIKTIRADVRLVAATHTELRTSVDTGSFREDLYYRLNVVPIRLPSLRERAVDIPLLATYFVERFNQRLSKRVVGIAPEAEQALVKYSWPGNIRELENVIERAVLFCDGDAIHCADLPPELRPEGSEVNKDSGAAEEVDTAASSTVVAEGLKEQVKAAMSRLERELIDKALRQTSGNVTHAARLLKISRKGLQLKMKELGLRERDDRPD